MAVAAGATGVEVVEIADEGLLGDASAPMGDTAMRAQFAMAKGSGIELDPAPIEIAYRIHVRFDAH